MKTLALLSLLAALVLLSGCQSWTRGGDYRSTQLGYRVSTPSDWIYHPTFGGQFFATKDGFFLQRLTVTRGDVSKPLPHTKRTLGKTASPLELAEAMIDNLKADRSLQKLEILENAPVKLDQQPAVRLVTQHTTEDGNRVKTASYFCIRGDHLYTLSLAAPARHYFDASLPVFEETARSFAFIAP